MGIKKLREDFYMVICIWTFGPVCETVVSSIWRQKVVGYDILLGPLSIYSTMCKIMQNENVSDLWLPWLWYFAQIRNIFFSLELELRHHKRRKLPHLMYAFEKAVLKILIICRPLYCLLDAFLFFVYLRVNDTHVWTLGSVYFVRTKKMRIML